ncbi:hypothetical protein Q8W71_27350 [Methylobacterium sp. NEAU 140]|uniref:hypothetical protein n=1 Tax=Methylobacterium sp. NEAU 140 TaxID=3064945 RepID=UPI0027353E30|nr:hypothetical protein [Methylobacterium sp. NEAU 140]MDP4026345.1 hypothetical protein [Methylobacterium sp. NEAU 140]
MPGHHGQTYDPNEEPAPRGGWFRLVDRPFPERLDRTFRGLAAVLGGLLAALGVGVALYGLALSGDGKGAGIVLLLVAAAATMAYGFVRAVGMILVAVYGAARDGPELIVDWRALGHDLRLRRVRVVLIEFALLCAAMGGMVWGMILFVREGSLFGLAMFALVNAMTFWPFVRRWMLTGRAD